MNELAQGERGALGRVIPAPTEVIPGAGRFRLAGADVVATGPARPIGEYLTEALAQRGAAGGSAAAVDLDLDPALAPDDDGPGDGYTLVVAAEAITLRAATPAGLFHGAQTLLQLVAPDLTVPAGRIVDRPRFAYRGLMLDVARHFFGVADVKRVIDHAAAYKLNHLHLHLTDDQGWRIVVDAWPRLTSHGGGTEVGDGPGGFYTKAEYAELVAYAQRRFITVVPEIDLPGHTNAALASYPELTADGTAPPRYTGIEVGFSALQPDAEVTYRFLDAVFGELAALTPGEYLHLGGDEAKTMEPDAYVRIINRAQEIVAAHGKTVIGWHEIAAAKLAPSTVVQFWGATPESPELVAAAAQGNRIIMSPADRAYLDMAYDEASPLGLSWAGYVSLRRAYEWNPVAHVPGLDPATVLGVEAALWTETTATVADLEYLAFPRLAAVAEVAWSGAGDWESFRARLAAQAPDWVRRGVNFYRTPEIDWPVE